MHSVDAQVLRKLGAIAPTESVQPIIRAPEFLGASAPTIARHVIELFDITSHTADELVTWKRETSIELTTRPVSEGGADLASLWYDGVTSAVRRLDASGVAIALCTSNLRPVRTPTTFCVGDFRSRVVLNIERSVVR